MARSTKLVPVPPYVFGLVRIYIDPEDNLATADYIEVRHGEAVPVPLASAARILRGVADNMERVAAQQADA